MFRLRRFVLLLGALLWTWSTHAKERGTTIVEVTHEQALLLARKQGPALAIATARVSEAESQVKAASVRRYNPEIQTTAGPRFDTGDTATDWSVEARHWFDLGGLREYRINAARAGVLAELAHSQDARRLLLREVSLTFINALYWNRRVELAKENLRIASEIHRVANRRHSLGDVGGLEKSVALLWVARARSAVDRAGGVLGQTQGRLKVLLGIESKTELVPRGDLRQLSGPLPAEANTVERPDLQALRQEMRKAEAQADLGRARRMPKLALGASYSREEDAEIVQGNLAISLPLFDHGQGITAVSQARRNRAKAELREASRRAVIETDTIHATARKLSVTVVRFEQDGLAMLKRAERLATTSYKAGAIPLGELLSFRRELVQTKLDYTELLLAAAIAWTELAASTGTLR